MRTLAAPLAIAGALSVVGSPRSGAAEEPPKQNDPVIAVVLDRVVRESERKRAASMIVGVLFRKYAEEHGIEASDEDIQSFVERNRAMRDEHVRERTEEVEVLRAELEAPDLDDEQRAEKRNRLELLQRLLESEEQVKAHRREKPEEVEASEREVAEQFVRGWKLNQALYAQYGGRVIFQQAGPEPIDAYRAFLEEEQKKGSFQILDPRLRQTFWRYFLDDKMHTFLSDDVGKQAMATPWWLLEKPIDE